MVNLQTLVTPECALMLSVLCTFSFMTHSSSTGGQVLMNLLCMGRNRGEGRGKERKALKINRVRQYLTDPLSLTHACFKVFLHYLAKEG